MAEDHFLECRFHPFARHHYLIPEVTPKGCTDFRVPWPADRPFPAEASAELAAIKDRTECPKWARDWKDEFYIEILNRNQVQPAVEALKPQSPDLSGTKVRTRIVLLGLVLIVIGLVAILGLSFRSHTHQTLVHIFNLETPETALSKMETRRKIIKKEKEDARRGMFLPDERFWQLEFKDWENLRDRYCKADPNGAYIDLEDQPQKCGVRK